MNDIMDEPDVPLAAIMDGPVIEWAHIDGPLLVWAGRIHWLTWLERAQLWIGWSSVDDIARRRFPTLDWVRELHRQPRA